ncbi:hypothetical protein ACFXG4_04845 [Nocardia sp. NPDC059246]|uniref:hypothetical protein n=1 Tax=unclassified Nocardia TaxID=2637762 RepID=UPI0036BAC068
MSSGQKPRWRAYFPRMKHRGRGRRRPGRIILWQDGKAVWPNPFHPKRGRPPATITMRSNSPGEGSVALALDPRRGPYWRDIQPQEADNA